MERAEKGPPLNSPRRTTLQNRWSLPDHLTVLSAFCSLKC